MKTHFLLIPVLLTAAIHAEPANPRIDYAGFVVETQKLQPIREARRVSEEKFLEMAAEPGTVVLDARSRERYDQLHVKGALHLDISDFTEAALREIIPDTATRVLIYCNNNFENEPVNFAAKAITVSLNMQTFLNLNVYGYKNVYELGPLLDVKTTKIPFAGEAACRE